MVVWLRLAATAAVMLASMPLSASPLEDPLVSGTAVFTGPTRAHGSAIFVNPGALGLATTGKHVLVMGTTRLSQVKIDRNYLDPSGAISPGPTVRDLTASPGGMITLDGAPSNLIRLGLAIQTPFAEFFIDDQPDLSYHTSGGGAFQLTGAASLTFVATSRIMIGFAISLGHTWFRMKFDRDSVLDQGSAGVAGDCDGTPCGFENPNAAESYDIRAKTDGILQGKNVGLSVGGLFRVKGPWWLGVSYVSPPGAIAPLDLPGEVTVNQAPRDGGMELKGDAEVTFKHPQSVYLGVRGPILPGYEILINGRWQNLSRHEEYDYRFFGGNLAQGDVPDWMPRYRGFRDVLSIDAGVESEANNRVRFGGRMRIESGGSRKEDFSPVQVAGFNATASGGAEYRLGDHVVVSGNYGFTWFPPLNSTDNTFNPLDRIRCIDANLDFDSCDGVRTGTALPTASGRYSRVEHSFALSIRWDSL